MMPKDDLVIPVWLPKDFLEFLKRSLPTAAEMPAFLNRTFWCRQKSLGDRLHENLALTLLKLAPKTMTTGESTNWRIRSPFSLHFIHAV